MKTEDKIAGVFLLLSILTVLIYAAFNPPW